MVLAMFEQPTGLVSRPAYTSVSTFGELLWNFLGIKSGISVCELLSTSKNKNKKQKNIGVE